MMFFVSEKFNRYFRENLEDWCIGGPKNGGWTRAGTPTEFIDVNLTACLRGIISVEEALAKNRSEVEKWHLDFLRGHPQLYFVEYLDTRYDQIQADERAKTFLDLLENMRKEGFDPRYPICVADILPLDLGFRYFRFDGCHRTCCAKHLGIKEIPAYIFSIEALSKT